MTLLNKPPKNYQSTLQNVFKICIALKAFYYFCFVTFLVFLFLKLHLIKQGIVIPDFELLSVSTQA